MTGLLNRAAFEVALAEELSVFTAGGGRCGALLIAIDGDDTAIAVAAEALARASRSEDRVAHLGRGELAVLFSGIDGKRHRGRHRAADRRRTRAVASCAAPTPPRRPGEDVACPPAAASARGCPSQPIRPPDAAAWRGPEGIARLLELARTQLGMALSFLTRITNDEYVFMRFDGEPAPFGVGEGGAMPLSDSYCERMLDGRIASIIPDASADPHTRVLELTSSSGSAPTRGFRSACAPARSTGPCA